MAAAVTNPPASGITLDSSGLTVGEPAGSGLTLNQDSDLSFLNGGPSPVIGVENLGVGNGSVDGVDKLNHQMVVQEMKSSGILKPLFPIQPMLGQPCVYYERGMPDVHLPAPATCCQVLGPGVIDLFIIGGSSVNSRRDAVYHNDDPRLVNNPSLRENGVWDWLEAEEKRRPSRPIRHRR